MHSTLARKHLQRLVEHCKEPQLQLTAVILACDCSLEAPITFECGTPSMLSCAVKVNRYSLGNGCRSPASINHTIFTSQLILMTAVDISDETRDKLPVTTTPVRSVIFDANTVPHLLSTLMTAYCDLPTCVDESLLVLRPLFSSCSCADHLNHCHPVHCGAH